MVSKFALLSNLFLAFAALALPPSQLGARLARGEDIQPQLSNHSSITPRRTNFNHDWAGVEHNSWGLFLLQIESVTVTLVVPAVTSHPEYPNSDVTFAISIGKSGCGNNFLLTGFRIKVTNNEVSDARPVYGTSFENIQEFEYAPIESGDIITLTAEVTTVFGGTVTVHNSDPSRTWTRTQDFNTHDDGDGSPICTSFAQVMVVASALPVAQGGGHFPLANFQKAIFTELRVYYKGYPNGEFPAFLEYYDLEEDNTEGKLLTLTYEARETIVVSYQLRPLD